MTQPDARHPDDTQPADGTDEARAAARDRMTMDYPVKFTRLPDAATPPPPPDEATPAR